MHKRDKLDNLTNEMLLEEAEKEMPTKKILKKILENMKEVETEMNKKKLARMD